MLQILQKAKFSFQSAIIKNSHVSDYNPRFGNSKKPTQALKYRRAYLMFEMINYYKDVKKCTY